MKNAFEKTFNHTNASIADKISLVGELQHGRRHCIRSAASAWREEDDSDSTRYLIWAKRFQEIRREYMRKHFGKLKETDWCLIKVCAELRSLAYEVCEGDVEELKEIEDLIDEITSDALGVDLSGCQSCREDSEEVEPHQDYPEGAIPLPYIENHNS